MAQRRFVFRCALPAALVLAGLLSCLAPLHANEELKPGDKKAGQAETGGTDEMNPLLAELPFVTPDAVSEIKTALVRLPLAAILGTALALRPRRRDQGRRTVTVVQTQIMLAVVGAVIMLVVGNSLSRAFGIVGAAGLVRYRSSIDDPKEAVVMLCALGAGLASGVGLYLLAPFATVFMAAVLWAVEYFEPAARKFLELSVTTKDATAFRPKVEGVLHGLGLEYELLAESDEMVSYSVSAPLDVRTRDVSDTLRLLAGEDDMTIEWEEKKPKR